LFFVGGSNRCVDYSGEFISGFLGCVGCQVNTQDCVGAPVGFCGDGFINIGEECDGVRFGNVDECSDFDDFVSGVLRCSSCRLSTSSCVAGPDCGNGVVILMILLMVCCVVVVVG